MRVYVSSTYEDLVEHRAAAISALRQLGHDVAGMEDYTLSTGKPLDKVLEDFGRCDAYVGVNVSGELYRRDYGLNTSADSKERNSLTASASSLRRVGRR